MKFKKLLEELSNEKDEAFGSTLRRFGTKSEKLSNELKQLLDVL